MLLQAVLRQLSLTSAMPAKTAVCARLVYLSLQKLLQTSFLTLVLTAF
ncbi:Uncharacterised protein [Vibrio cholerae]|nr:Uncharacterised protein [Vibrio cholerae]